MYIRVHYIICTTWAHIDFLLIEILWSIRTSWSVMIVTMKQMNWVTMPENLKACMKSK